MAVKRKLKKKSTGPYQSEKKVYAQIRFFEVLHIVKGPDGEVLFTGNEDTAAKVLKMLNSERKSGKGRKRGKQK